MKFMITVIGLMMIFEGLPYFAFPEKMKETMRHISEMPPDSLRRLGFMSLMAGLFLCYLARRTGIFDG
jgi:uncharacterized protein YjeT (DUF2065 family)